MLLQVVRSGEMCSGEMCSGEMYMHCSRWSVGKVSPKTQALLDSRVHMRTNEHACVHTCILTYSHMRMHT